MPRFKINETEDVEQIRQELNRVLKNVQNELDRLGGYSGDIQMPARTIHTNDLIFDAPNKGVVLKDDGTPPRFWRLWVDSSGSVYTETMDAEFKD